VWASGVKKRNVLSKSADRLGATFLVEFSFTRVLIHGRLGRRVGEKKTGGEIIRKKGLEKNQLNALNVKSSLAFWGKGERKQICELTPK